MFRRTFTTKWPRWTAVIPSRRSEGACANRRRQGAVTLEFLLAFVVLFVISLAIFQFFMIGLTQQLLVTAATEAARYGAEATVDGSLAAAADSATAAAEAYLKAQGLELTNADADAADGSMFIERRVGTGVTETTTVGDGPSCPTSALPTRPLGPDQIRVTLCFPLVESTDPSGVGNPIGNWLSGFGFDLSGSVISYSSLARIE